MVLTIVDQGASSVSNFALALIVAHYSSASALGVFAILTSTYVLSQGLVRSLSSDCLLTRSENDEGLRSNYERAGYLAAIVLSVSLAAVIPVVSGMLPGEFTLPFVIFAVSFPLMACQDFARFIGISRYDPAYAIRLDLAWLVLFLVAYVVLKQEGLTTLAWLFGAWSGAGALVGLWTLRAHFARTGRRQLLAVLGRERAGRRPALRRPVHARDVVDVLRLVPAALRPAPGLHRRVQAGPARPGAHHGAAGRRAVGPHRAGDQALPGRHAAGGPLPPLGGVGLVRPHHGLDRRSSTAHRCTSCRACSAATGGRPGSSCPTPGWRWPSTSFANAANSGLRAMRAASENLRLSVVMVPFLFVLCIGGAELFGTRGAAGGLAHRRRHLLGPGWTPARQAGAHLRPGDQRGRPGRRGGGRRAVTPASAVGDVHPHRAARPARRRGSRGARRTAATSRQAMTLSVGGRSSECQGVSAAVEQVDRVADLPQEGPHLGRRDAEVRAVARRVRTAAPGAASPHRQQPPRPLHDEQLRALDVDLDQRRRIAADQLVERRDGHGDAGRPRRRHAPAPAGSAHRGRAPRTSPRPARR